jgi:hypothetical protein
LGVKISREQAAALFLRHGCDAQGLLPYEVFAAKLQVWKVIGGQLLNTRNGLSNEPAPDQAAGQHAVKHL